MSPIVRAELRAELNRLQRDVMDIRAYDRRQPHCFAEDKSEIRARLRKLELALNASDTKPSRPAQSALVERTFRR